MFAPQSIRAVMAAPIDATSLSDVKRMCKKLDAGREKRAAETSARYLDLAHPIRVQIRELKKRLDELERAEEEELVPEPLEAFAEKTLRVLEMIKAARDGQGVIDGGRIVEEWGKLAKSHLDVHPEIVWRVRAELVEHTRLQRAQFRARGHGEARGYKSEDSILDEIGDPEISRDDGNRWEPVDDDEFVAPDGESAEEYAFYFLEREGKSHIDEWDAKECLVSGWVEAECTLLLPRRSSTED